MIRGSCRPPQELGPCARSHSLMGPRSLNSWCAMSVVIAVLLDARLGAPSPPTTRVSYSGGGELNNARIVGGDSASVGDPTGTVRSGRARLTRSPVIEPNGAIARPAGGGGYHPGMTAGQGAAAVACYRQACARQNSRAGHPARGMTGIAGAGDGEDQRRNLVRRSCQTSFY